MNSEDLLKNTLEILETSIFTKTIPSKLHSAKHAEKICRLTFELVNKDMEEYNKAVHYFIDLSSEFVILQTELNKSDRYRYSTFKEVEKNILKNPEVMSRRYLYGLLFSQAFWINHSKIYSFFLDKFCRSKQSGSVLEVPVGTGIFISEFMNRNIKWEGTGYDISRYSVEFAKKLSKILSGGQPAIEQKNIFDIESRKYDKIICGELLEHVEDPASVLKKLRTLLKPDGEVFITAAVFAASIDHIYLYRNVNEVRKHISQAGFRIREELALAVSPGDKPEHGNVPVNYAAIITHNYHSS